jgi:hypothetical protein
MSDVSHVDIIRSPAYNLVFLRFRMDSYHIGQLLLIDL